MPEMGDWDDYYAEYSDAFASRHASDEETYGARSDSDVGPPNLSSQDIKSVVPDAAHLVKGDPWSSINMISDGSLFLRVLESFALVSEVNAVGICAVHYVACSTIRGAAPAGRAVSS